MIKTENVKMAKCGLTTLSKCRTRKANLPECDGCKFVLRRFDRWKMIDKKPYKKCLSCGKFLPVNKYYVKKIKKPDGTYYESTGSRCKMCISDEKRKKRNYEL